MTQQNISLTHRTSSIISNSIANNTDRMKISPIVSVFFTRNNVTQKLILFTLDTNVMPQYKKYISCLLGKSRKLVSGPCAKV